MSHEKWEVCEFFFYGNQQKHYVRHLIYSVHVLQCDYFTLAHSDIDAKSIYSCPLIY